MIYDFFDSLQNRRALSIFAVHLQSNRIMYKPIIDEEGPHCLECGEVIWGRPDKKFCNSDCRNAWHSHLRSLARQMHSNTISVLNNNYAILSGMLQMKKSSCPVGSLKAMGFNPELVTHKGEKVGRHIEYRCFDLAYSLTHGKLFNLHRV